MFSALQQPAGNVFAPSANEIIILFLENSFFEVDIEYKAGARNIPKLHTMYKGNPFIKCVISMGITRKGE